MLNPPHGYIPGIPVRSLVVYCNFLSLMDNVSGLTCSWTQSNLKTGTTTTVLNTYPRKSIVGGPLSRKLLFLLSLIFFLEHKTIYSPNVWNTQQVF